MVFCVHLIAQSAQRAMQKDIWTQQLTLTFYNQMESGLNSMNTQYDSSVHKDWSWFMPTTMSSNIHISE